MPAYLGGPLPEPEPDYFILEDAADINDYDDRERIQVKVPEWKRTVELLAPAAFEVDRYQDELVNLAAAQGKRVALQNARAKLIALCAVKPGTTERLWKTPDDVRKLGRKNTAALARLDKAAGRLCLINERDIEDLVKNFAETPDDDGQFDSPEGED